MRHEIKKHTWMFPGQNINLNTDNYIAKKPSEKIREDIVEDLVKAVSESFDELIDWFEKL